MPAEHHLLVEAVYCVEVVSQDELKVAGCVEPDPLVAERRLVEAKTWTKVHELLHRTPRIGPWKLLPQPFRQLEPRQRVEPVLEVAADVAQARPLERKDDHVRVRREQPPVGRVGAPCGRVAADRLDGGKMRSLGESIAMKLGRDAKHAKPVTARPRQGVRDGLDERRKLVRGVVVDEKDLVVVVGEHLGQAIEAQGRAAMQVVPVRVVPAVEDDRDHT